MAGVIYCFINFFFILILVLPFFFFGLCMGLVTWVALPTSRLHLSRIPPCPVRFCFETGMTGVIGNSASGKEKRLSI